MRTILLLLGLLSLGCRNGTAPQFDIQGTWSQDGNVPGASLVITIAESSGTLQGSGTYTIEAGQPGSLQVTGTHSGRNVTLALAFDTDLVETWNGTIQDASHMTGLVDRDPGGPVTMSFTRGALAGAAIAGR